MNPKHRNIIARAIERNTTMFTVSVSDIDADFVLKNNHNEVKRYLRKKNDTLKDVKILGTKITGFNYSDKTLTIEVEFDAARVLQMHGAAALVKPEEPVK